MDTGLNVYLDAKNFKQEARGMEKALDRVGDEADKTQRRVSRFSKGAAGGFSSLKKKMFSLQTAFAGLSASILAIQTLRIGAQFEQSIKSAAGVMGILEGQANASIETFEALGNAAKRMGETTEFSATQAAGALQFLGMAGFNATQSISALPGVIDLATASGIDLARSADIASNALTAMGLSVSDLGRVNDVFIATITRSNTNMEMMAESFKYSAPLARAYGYEIETLAAYIGILGNAGIQGSMAGTQLAQAFVRLPKVMRSLKMESGNLTDALIQMNKQNWNASRVMKEFDQRSGRAILVLKELIPEIKRLEAANIGAAGELRTLADHMRDTTMGAFKGLKSVIESIQIDVFENNVIDLKGSLQDLTETIRDNKTDILAFVHTFVDVGKDLGTVAIHIASIFKYTADGWMALPPLIRDIGIIGALFGGAKAKAAILLITTAIGLGKELYEVATTRPTEIGIIQSIIDAERDLEEARKRVDLAASKGLQNSRAPGMVADRIAVRELTEELVALNEELVTIQKVKVLALSLSEEMAQATNEEAAEAAALKRQLELAGKAAELKIDQDLALAKEWDKLHKKYIDKGLLNELEAIDARYLAFRIAGMDLVNAERIRTKQINEVTNKYYEQAIGDFKRYADVYEGEFVSFTDRIGTLADVDITLEWLAWSGESVADTIAEVEKTLDILEGKVKDTNDKIKDNTEKTTDLISELWIRAMNRVQESLADTFYDAFTGNLDNVKDVFKSFLDDILRMMAEHAAKMTMYSLFGIGKEGGGWGGLFSSIMGAIGGSGGSGGGGIGGVGGSDNEDLFGKIKGYISALRTGYSLYSSAGSLFGNTTGIGVGTYGSSISGASLMQGSGSLAGGAGGSASMGVAGGIAAAVAVAFAMLMEGLMEANTTPDAYMVGHGKVSPSADPDKLFDFKLKDFVNQGFDSDDAKNTAERIGKMFVDVFGMYEGLFQFVSDDSKDKIKDAMEGLGDWDFNIQQFGREGAPITAWFEGASSWVKGFWKQMPQSGDTPAYKQWVPGHYEKSGKTGGFSAAEGLSKRLGPIFENYIEEAITNIKAEEVFGLLTAEIIAGIEGATKEKFMDDPKGFFEQFGKNITKIAKAASVYSNFNDFIDGNVAEYTKLNSITEEAKDRLAGWVAIMEQSGEALSEEDITKKFKSIMKGMTDGLSGQELGDAADKMTAMDHALAVVNGQFDTYLELLKKNGVDLDKITDLESKRAKVLERTAKELREGVLGQISAEFDGLKGVVGPLEQQIGSINSTFATWIIALKEINASAEELNATEEQWLALLKTRLGLTDDNYDEERRVGLVSKYKMSGDDLISMFKDASLDDLKDLAKELGIADWSDIGKDVAFLMKVLGKLPDATKQATEDLERMVAVLLDRGPEYDASKIGKKYGWDVDVPGFWKTIEGILGGGMERLGAWAKSLGVPLDELLRDLGILKTSLKDLDESIPKKGVDDDTPEDLSKDLAAYIDNVRDSFVDMLGLLSPIEKEMRRVNKEYAAHQLAIQKLGGAEKEVLDLERMRVAILAKLAEKERKWIEGMRHDILGDTKIWQVGEIAKKYGWDLTAGDFWKDVLRILRTASIDELKAFARAKGVDLAELFADLGILKTYFEDAEGSAKSFADAVKRIGSMLDEVSEDIAWYNWQIANGGQGGALRSQYLMERILEIQDNPDATVFDVERMTEYLVEWYRSATSEAQIAAQDAARLEQETARAWEQVADSVKQLVQSIESTILNIKYSGLNVGLPQSKRISAQGDYASLLSKAQTGGVNDVQDYLSFASTYLEQAQEDLKSSQAYQTIYSQVLADMEGIKSRAEAGGYDQLIYENIVEGNDQVHADLTAINATFKDLEAWIRSFTQQVKDNEVWMHILWDSASSDTVITALNDLLSRYGWSDDIIITFITQLGINFAGTFKDRMTLLGFVASGAGWEGKATIELLASTAFWTPLSFSQALEALGFILDATSGDWKSNAVLTFLANTGAWEGNSWADNMRLLGFIFGSSNFADADWSSTAVLTFLANTGAWDSTSFEEAMVGLKFLVTNTGWGSEAVLTWIANDAIWDSASFEQAMAALGFLFGSEGWTMDAALKMVAQLSDVDGLLWSDIQKMLLEKYGWDPTTDAEKLLRLKAAYDDGTNGSLPSVDDLKRLLEPHLSETVMKAIQSGYSGDMTLSELQQLLSDSGVPESLIRNITTDITGGVQVTLTQEDSWIAMVGLLLGILQNTALIANATSGQQQHIDTLLSYWNLPSVWSDFLTGYAYSTTNTFGPSGDPSTVWEADPYTSNLTQLPGMASYLSSINSYSYYTNNSISTYLHYLNYLSSMNTSLNRLSTIQSHIGLILQNMRHQNINWKYPDSGGITWFKEGGIATGPESGYPVTLHGTEAIVPLPSGAIPVQMLNGGSTQEGASRPLHITVEVAGEEFYSEVKQISRVEADYVRVQANKTKNNSTKRLYR